METQPTNSIRKVIQLAFVSLITGIVAILPYLTLAINILLNWLFPDAWAGIWIPTPCGYFSNGIVFGSVSLLTSILAIREMKHKQGFEADHRLAMIGRLLGILGIVANLIFYIAMMLVMLRD